MKDLIGPKCLSFYTKEFTIITWAIHYRISISIVLCYYNWETQLKMKVRQSKNLGYSFQLFFLIQKCMNFLLEVFNWTEKDCPVVLFGWFALHSWEKSVHKKQVFSLIFPLVYETYCFWTNTLVLVSATLCLATSLSWREVQAKATAAFCSVYSEPAF